MATPAHGPKTGKDGQETGKEKGHAVGRGLGWLGIRAFRRASWQVLECRNRGLISHKLPISL